MTNHEIITHLAAFVAGGVTCGAMVIWFLLSLCHTVHGVDDDREALLRGESCHTEVTETKLEP